MKKIIILFFVMFSLPVFSSQGDNLVKSAANGSLEGVKKALLRGADVNSTDKAGQTALMKSARRDDIEIMKYLISHGADINLEDKFGDNALMLAIENGKSGSANYLQQMGAVVDVFLSHKLKVLISGIEKGDLEIVEHVISEEGYIPYCDDEGRTALVTAAGYNNLKIIKYLVSRGANVNSDNMDGKTALIAASGKGYLSIVKYLVSAGAYVGNADDAGHTPLMWAYAGGHDDVADFLKASGAYDCSIECKDLGCLRDASTDIQENFFQAVREGNLKALKNSVSRGALINVEDGICGSAIIKAVRADDYEITEFLVSHGADVNAVEPEVAYASVLMIAAYNGNLDIVKLLVSSGADVSFRLNGMTNALTYASERGKLDVLDYLLPLCRKEAGDIESTLMLWAARSSQIGMVEYLLNRGADINFQNSLFGGSTAVMFACTVGDIELLNFLVVRGADVNLEDYTGETAMSKAVKNDNFDIINFLEYMEVR